MLKIKVFKNYKSLFLLLSLVLLSSCASKQFDIVEIEQDSHSEKYLEAHNRWEKLKEYNTFTAPMMVDGTLRFGYDGKTQRVNFLLWTNDGSTARVDISAGFTTYANIYANANSSNYLGIYLPTEKTLLVSNDVDYKNGFSVLDIEFPFSIHTLIDIIEGNFSYYVGNDYEKVYEEIGKNIFTYQINIQSNNEKISLDTRARVIDWVFHDWSLQFAYKDSFKPSKISATNINGNSLTIYISSIQEKEIFSNDSFNFKLQDGYILRDLDKENNLK